MSGDVTSRETRYLLQRMIQTLDHYIIRKYIILSCHLTSHLVKSAYGIKQNHPKTYITKQERNTRSKITMVSASSAPPPPTKPQTMVSTFRVHLVTWVALYSLSTTNIHCIANIITNLSV